jgi:dynein heavy chain
MKNAVRDIIEGALETVGTSPRAEWVQDWPCQAVLVAAFLNATTQCQEAIKGGTGALKDLSSKYLEFNEELSGVIEDTVDNATQEVLSSMMIHDLYTRDTIACLIKDQVVSEKDYTWRSRPK